MFVLQGGEDIDHKLLKALYDYFYTILDFSVQKQEVEECH